MCRGICPERALLHVGKVLKHITSRCIVSLLNVVPAQVTYLFILYVLADFLWILVQPATLPSLHTVILGHHVVTVLLLTFPLRHPGFAHFTCWDGLTELNTFFLVARRQFPAYFGLLHT